MKKPTPLEIPLDIELDIDFLQTINQREDSWNRLVYPTQVLPVFECPICSRIASFDADTCLACETWIEHIRKFKF